ncbi:Imm1 family immunity protein [Actinopolyspora mortivallis]|uniref:Imm1 family immunity protein n=1 Tax=Actinopolyspora mortivallis TaxID=33906 RepID=UPI00047DBD4D|nr:Imm1 family immunity protein [Actinopolyspora mortivallis]
MSNPPSHDESAAPENLSEVFARLTDVPLEQVDKLVETVESAYADLNRVMEHPYWADLVFHQGSTLRALREARAELDAFRAEATGARNTELGIMVATGVIDGRREYAEDEESKRALVERLLRPPRQGLACHLYVWDRPHEDDQVPGPYQHIRVVTSPEEEMGALTFTEEQEDGQLYSWQTHNRDQPEGVPTLRFDRGSALTFPRSSVVGFSELRTALDEFVRTGECPRSVEWRQARWGE